MDNHWYFKHNETVFGPVNFSELKALKKSGHIHNQSPVCRKGMQDWISYYQLMASTGVFADRKNRFGGFCLDLAVVFFLVVIAFSFLNVTLLSGRFEQANINPMILYFTFGLTWLAYEAFFAYYKGTPSLGKRFFGIAVANTRGREAPSSQLMLRSFLKVLLLIVIDFFRLSGVLGPIYFLFLGVFIPFGVRKKTVYDYVSDTVCMKNNTK